MDGQAQVENAQAAFILTSDVVSFFYRSTIAITIVALVM